MSDEAEVADVTVTGHRRACRSSRPGRAKQTVEQVDVAFPATAPPVVEPIQGRTIRNEGWHGEHARQVPDGFGAALSSARILIGLPYAFVFAV
jgi:hypothetical protein